MLKPCLKIFKDLCTCLTFLYCIWHNVGNRQHQLWFGCTHFKSYQFHIYFMYFHICFIKEGPSFNKAVFQVSFHYEHTVISGQRKTQYSNARSRHSQLTFQPRAIDSHREGQEISLSPNLPLPSSQIDFL